MQYTCAESIQINAANTKATFRFRHVLNANFISVSAKDQFLFEEITVLPQKGGEDNFAGEAVTKRIPKRNFRNEHLPDLRASYLAEMIQVYSKKFDPIILEGEVKSFKGEDERNAIIYLFIPETILAD